MKKYLEHSDLKPGQEIGIFLDQPEFNDNQDLIYTATIYEVFKGTEAHYPGFSIEEIHDIHEAKDFWWCTDHWEDDHGYWVYLPTNYKNWKYEKA